MLNWGSGREDWRVDENAGHAGHAGHAGYADTVAGHSHAHSTLPAVPTSRTVARATLLTLLAVAVLTVLGMVWLWPSQAAVGQMVDRAQALTGVTESVRGEVLGVSDPCAEATAADGPTQCVEASIGLLSGPDAGRLVTVALTGGLDTAVVSRGDQVQLAASERVFAEGAEPARGEMTMSYTFAGVDRTLPLVVLALLFAGVVIAVGRRRGLFALLALGVSGAVLGFFVLPALVSGGPGLLIGMVGSTAIMFVTLFFVHGWNLRTAAALIGTLFGILMVSAISLIAVASTRLSGVGDEASGFLTGLAAGLDLRGLLTCSILIAGLGVLNDITIAQASSVWELRAAAPHLPRREIYARAMRIGRDHIASTVYTVVFAYVGAALSVLILLYLAEAPVLALFTREDIAIEVVRTLCGSIGLVLAVPVTTAAAAWLVAPERPVDAT